MTNASQFNSGARVTRAPSGRISFQMIAAETGSQTDVE
jgi:hypothetical protein